MSVAYWLDWFTSTEAFIRIILAFFAVALVHLGIILLQRQNHVLGVGYSKDRLALKLVCSVGYFVYFVDETIFAESRYPVSVLVLLTILIAVRSSYAFVRTKNRIITIVEFVSVLAEYPTTIIFLKAGRWICRTYLFHPVIQ